MDGASDFVTQATLELAVGTRNQFRPPPFPSNTGEPRRARVRGRGAGGEGAAINDNHS